MSDDLDRIALHSGDCSEILPTLAENSLDACVTDPPYHLTSIVKRMGSPTAAPVGYGSDGRYQRVSGGFMGKQWDGGDIAFRPEIWRAVWRVLKPGAHLLAFGGDRTFHRLACAIENAGFEVRGTIAWVFGSGFPKNHDVSKRMLSYFAEDDVHSCEHCDWQIVQDYSDDCSLYRRHGDAQPRSETDIDQASFLLQDDAREYSRDGLHEDGQVQGRANTFSGVANGHRATAGSSFQSARQSEDCQGRDNIQSDISMSRSRDGLTAEHKSLARRSGKLHSGDGLGASTRYENLPQCPTCGKRGIPGGLGTAIKPAMELICLARKPLSEGTVAGNVLKWGVGALNIDAARIPSGQDHADKCASVVGVDSNRNGQCYGEWTGVRENSFSSRGRGRWPANLIHDGSEEVVEGFPDLGISAGGRIGNAGGGNVQNLPVGQFSKGDPGFGDSGSAARFFYTAKADSDDRLGSKHPTVKPLDLMQYLVRLICPKGGTVLDPFAGTGSTGEAAFREGLRAVLIERESEYQADIRRRMELVLAGPDERAYAGAKERMKDKPRDDGPLFATPI